ncbi:MAG: hypothetical protein JXQ83_15330 [Candidatus Glassbacteria bacterium]|nr:hypothetical protein [Candidatus Glassbacteria bacterium]
MLVKILKPWICGGRVPAVGEVLDLPQALAGSGLERGLCERAGREKPGRKARAGSRRAVRES